ncbi:zinc-ribbon domain-containing protein [Methylobacterium soli]|uniref:Zinc finger/thioredoxin putative domain-containing protein n=1 Tax=Methylobacterium soli TaxID=553447 RepID=A0A6L3T342_9HYPH|nr:zinc-ribbon domain-containing protein [Methylobacterium soli]KAB1077533.1 hypothetical protein F6X53_18675 [Methylobacterium soli]GJE41720.1 hypothetical protein AEGHOMDF_0886 [Methylobacterium soli]
MLIVCPACASQYRIEADRVGMDGRSVRCAACRETWFITPADVLAGRAEELDIERFGADALAEAGPRGADASDAVVDNVPPRPRAGARSKARTGSAKARRGLAGISPAAAAALVLMAALPLALLARSTVVRAMPQTAGLYARIGLPVNLRGLELRDVVAFSSPAEAGRPAQLVIEGDVVGLAKGGAALSPIEVEVRDALDHALRTLTVPAPRPALAEGESARFRASFADPPAQGRAIELRFAPAVPAPEAPAAAERAPGAPH